jgi:hypothetical protein
MYGTAFSNVNYASQYPSDKKFFHNWGLGAADIAVYPPGTIPQVFVDALFFRLDSGIGLSCSCSLLPGLAGFRRSTTIQHEFRALGDQIVGANNERPWTF